MGDGQEPAGAQAGGADLVFPPAILPTTPSRWMKPEIGSLVGEVTMPWRAAATDARLAAAPERLAAAPERLELALLETREQLAQAQAELELRERRPELVPVPVPAPRPVEPQRTLSEAYADYRAPEPERGYSRGFGR